MVWLLSYVSYKVQLRSVSLISPTLFTNTNLSSFAKCNQSLNFEENEKKRLVWVDIETEMVYIFTKLFRILQYSNTLKVVPCVWTDRKYLLFNISLWFLLQHTFPCQKCCLSVRRDVANVLDGGNFKHAIYNVQAKRYIFAV